VRRADVSQSRYKFVDFGSVLMGVNVLVAGSILAVAQYAADNPYIDGETIMLGVLLSVQTQIVLQLESRRRDPFIILLAVSMIFYFALRVVTLALYPFSIVFERYEYGPGDTNFGLIFIICANVFLYSGLYAVRLGTSRQSISAEGWRPSSGGSVVVLMLMAIVYAYFTGIYWTPEEIPRVVGFLGVVLSPNIILLMALSYFFLFRRSLARNVAIAMASLIVIEMVAHTLVGSRSAVTTLIQNCLLVALAIAGCIRFRQKWLVLGSIFFPILLFVMVASFTISTYNRANKDSGSTLSLGRALQLAGESGTELAGDSSAELILPPIFSRVGFLDYSSEIIAHRDRYNAVINPASYVKSIIDNLLTPGFDVYDQPKISNALKFVYDDLGTPSKEMVEESYQSDQLGIYGEFYGLFGYASLPLFFVIAFLIKRTYVSLRNVNPFTFTMKRVVILSVFVKIVDSYGMDWVIIETVPLVAAIYIYSRFFRCRLVATRGTVDPSGAREHFQAGDLNDGVAG
jgi:hypothetical protein